MNLQYALTILLMLSGGTILYMIVRTLPRIEEDGVPGREERRGVFEKFLMSRLPEELDAIFGRAAVKLLRRLRVITLRLDNFIGEQLRSMRAPAPAASLKEVAVEVEEERRGTAEIRKR